MKEQWGAFSSVGILKEELKQARTARLIQQK